MTSGKLYYIYLVNDFHAKGVADLPVELGAHHVGFARGAVGAEGVPEIDPMRSICSC